MTKTKKVSIPVTLTLALPSIRDYSPKEQKAIAREILGLNTPKGKKSRKPVKVVIQIKSGIYAGETVSASMKVQ